MLPVAVTQSSSGRPEPLGTEREGKDGKDIMHKVSMHIGWCRPQGAKNLLLRRLVHVHAAIMISGSHILLVFS